MESVGPTGKVKPSEQSIPMEIHILFIRHSYSCANLARNSSPGLRGKIKQVTYSDPELTERGKAMARDMGRRFMAELYPRLKGSTGSPVIVGSSPLLRAQQTALLITDPYQGKFPHIFVLPYIQEYGLGDDNQVRPNSNSYIKMNTTRRRKCAPTSVKSDHRLFLTWLGKYAPAMVAGSCDSEQRRVPKIQLIAVTHSNFMKKMMKDLFQKPYKFNNLDAVEIKVTYPPGSTDFKAELYDIYPYSPSPNVESMPDCPESGCRKETESNLCAMPRIRNTRKNLNRNRNRNRNQIQGNKGIQGNTYINISPTPGTPLYSPKNFPEGNVSEENWDDEEEY